MVPLVRVRHGSPPVKEERHGAKVDMDMLLEPQIYFRSKCKTSSFDKVVKVQTFQLSTCMLSKRQTASLRQIELQRILLYLLIIMLTC